MPEDIINWAELKEVLKKADNSLIDCKCNYKKYLQWAKADPKDMAYLISLGNLANLNNQVTGAMREYHWTGPEEPMALGYYPYSGCFVYQCMDCKRLFFYYREMGGHVPEMRLRLIREELLIFESPQ